LFEYISINQYQHALIQGKTSCKEAVRHYLSEIDKSKQLNAFVHVFADESIRKAAELDEKRKVGSVIGKLHGVVIAIKDVICYKDHPLTAASAILKNFTSLYSATAVKKLLEEEAIIIGICNCDEFAMGSANENSVYGNVLNAMDKTRVPGGSSGGSAVAVQAGLCMVSLGSDTGGSVRQPADFCGIIGLKPSYGRISRYGLIAYASSFDQIGIFGKNISDVATMLEVMAGPDEFDSTVSEKPVPSYSSDLITDKKFRFAYFDDALDHPGLDPEIASSIKKRMEQLRKDGHIIKPVEFDLLIMC